MWDLHRFNKPFVAIFAMGFLTFETLFCYIASGKNAKISTSSQLHSKKKNKLWDVMWSDDQKHYKNFYINLWSQSVVKGLILMRIKIVLTNISRSQRETSFISFDIFKYAENSSSKKSLFTRRVKVREHLRH